MVSEHRRLQRILSIAPRYRPGVDGSSGGHYTPYQDDLQAAASRLNLDYRILAQRSVMSVKGVDAVLDASSAQALARSTLARCQSGDVVVMYEGSLAMLRALAVVANQRRDVLFLVNLFKPEPGLDFVGTNARTSRLATRSNSFSGVEIPKNLLVIAETDERAFLARRLGIDCVGSWRLHSTLWNIKHELTSVSRSSDQERPAELRILVPHGNSLQAARSLAQVLDSMQIARGSNSIHFSITGADARQLAPRILGPQLEALGAHRLDSPVGRANYASIFAAHDVVWIPQSRSYRTQSSGKALDALVVGRPVIAPEGSWPARETSRWIGGGLTYRTENDLIELLTHLDQRIDALRDRLALQLENIRAAYSPDASLIRILEVVSQSGIGIGEGLGLSPPELPPASSSTLHKQVPGKQSQGPTPSLRFRYVSIATGFAAIVHRTRLAIRSLRRKKP